MPISGRLQGGLGSSMLTAGVVAGGQLQDRGRASPGLPSPGGTAEAEGALEWSRLGRMRSPTRALFWSLPVVATDMSEQWVHGRALVGRADGGPTEVPLGARGALVLTCRGW